MSSWVSCEKERLVKLVKEELKIDKLMSLNKLDLGKLSKLGSGNHVISQLSRKIGQSLNILAPLTTKCLLCQEMLTMNNPPSQIVVHGMNGPEVFSKYILRCKMCKLDRKSNYETKDKKFRQDVSYHPE
jgi:NurA-like 5'-3' nuclease